jgi:cytochrome c-type protein NapB
MRWRKGLGITTGVALLLVGVALAQDVADDELGLDKNSVFSTPDPIVPRTAQMDPGENLKLGSYFDDGPPLISHRIQDVLPITLMENLCLDCHDDLAMLGQEIAEDEPTPMPESHYTDLRRTPKVVGTAPIGARYVCTQCHAAQTDAVPLVDNTYKQ